MDVFPDFGGVDDLRAIVGALLMFVLITAVLMLIVCAIIWAVGSSSGNYQAATASGCWAPAALLPWPVQESRGSTSCSTSALSSDSLDLGRIACEHRRTANYDLPIDSR